MGQMNFCAVGEKYYIIWLMENKMYTFEQFLEDKKNISLNGVLFNLTD